MKRDEVAALKAEVAALRRIVDGYNTRLFMSDMHQKEMKLKMAKSVQFPSKSEPVSNLCSCSLQNGCDYQRAC
jgi:hypothetical protein